MIIFGFILGTILGSLSKALADRSLSGRSFWGRSFCPSCKHTLSWLDLFPILSYVLLGGRCRYCKKAMGLEYLLVEVVMGVLVGYLFTLSSSGLIGGSINKWIIDLIFKTFFITVLGTLFLTDIKKMLIPDRIIIPAIWIALAALALGTIYNNVGSQPLLGTLAAALATTLFFWALVVITRGKGMGGGDVKLGAFMGLGLGFPNTILAVMLAFFSGAAFSLAAIFLGKKNLKSHIPFGPFLVLGSLIALFWGNQIMDWYLEL